MRAVTRSLYGTSSVIEIREMDKPVPKDHEILIRVHATTVNRTDCAVLTGKPYIMRTFLGLTKPKQHVLGTDFSGVIEAVGSKVSKFKKGDRVYGFDDSGYLGSQAEWMTVKESKTILTIPDIISFQTAAASAEAAFYAWNFLNKVIIQAGQKILVNGGTGGIGSAAVQLLKHFGVEVTATCRGEHIQLVKSIGATQVIDYEKEDFTSMDLKFDHIFDTVGKSTFGKCKPLLKPKGKYISSELGPGGENIFLTLITPLLGGKVGLLAIPKKPKESLKKVRELLINKEFNPLIDKTYPMDRIREAYDYAATGRKVGNLLVSY